MVRGAKNSLSCLPCLSLPEKKAVFKTGWPRSQLTDVPAIPSLFTNLPPEGNDVVTWSHQGFQQCNPHMDSEIMTYMNYAKHNGLQKNTNTEIPSLMVVVTFRDPESTCSESRMEAEREEIRVRADTQTHPKSTGKNGLLRCSRD